MKNFLLAVLLCATTSFTLAQDADNNPMTLDGLLQAVRSGRVADDAANAQRLRDFRREKANQQKMRGEIIAEEQRQEAISVEQETIFEANEARISDLEDRLKERMGSLKELFGVLQQVASDAQAQFHVSLTQLEFPERNTFLVDFAGRMGQANRLPELAEIELLWFELQREMVESGRIVTRQQAVVDSKGSEIEQKVTRVGLFNAVANGKFLQFIPETGRLLEYSRQPDSRFTQGPEALAEGETQLYPFAVDPTRGQLLSILTQAPNLRERVDQGGVIGYIIISLGIFGVLLAIWRFIALMLESGRIRKQLTHLDDPHDTNALGRILLSYKEVEDRDVETLELKMGESVMRELPRITAHLPLLKIIAAVAPLMGLLGTVTGMIITFQAITLFGAGDPRLMAGGISQALITTVLGLTVAIPTLLLHNIVQGRARSLTDILQHEAVAVVAAQAEEKPLMMVFIDTWMPWLGDLLSLGGTILGLILIMAFLLWTLLWERLYYLFAAYPKHSRMAVRLWLDRDDKTSWYAQQYRNHLIMRISAHLNRNFSLIATIIKICPLLGLLGTVAGMLEVFDALAATGSNNPRSMAAGVSKATVSTLAGMVVAIFGMLTSKFAERRALVERDSLQSRFVQIGEVANA